MLPLQFEATCALLPRSCAGDGRSPAKLPAPEPAKLPAPAPALPPAPPRREPERPEQKVWEDRGVSGRVPMQVVFS